ncbi:hypothetical protein MKK64_05275 [Methylobacterium sp. E-025]|jgi:hypothetical protein|uniref:hypothetical protein n=1 Tax=Methylobacterium sp. E-025 TaxID=2836561 RepID=UPI001FBAAB6F|nr:hypothetical protein [Methylobacterium sp. E-025]MCJ2110616.1 hypothetical protein [Methylobacterium sp. E-025]
MLKALRAFAIALAMAVTFTTKLVWEGGRWVARSVRDSFRPPVGAGSQVEAEMEDLSAKAHQIAAAAQAPVAANDDGAGFGALIPVPEYDASQDWGAIAKAYVRARVYFKPEPSLADLDERTESWLRGLSTDECMRLHGLSKERIGSHIFGSHMLRGLAPCHEYDRGFPAILLADVEHPDARHQEILDDLENDPDVVPGYRVA